MGDAIVLKRWSVLNHIGELWTRDIFGTAEEAQAHIDAFQKGFKGDLSKHRPVRVRVTIEALSSAPEDGS